MQEQLFSNIRISPLNIEGKKVKALCSLTVADSIQLNKIKIVDGVNGLFISFPGLQNKSTLKYEDIFHTASKEARDALSQLLIEKYKEIIASKSISA